RASGRGLPFISAIPVYSLISLPTIAQDRSRPQSGAQVEIPLHTYFSCGPLPPATQAIWWFLSSGTRRKVHPTTLTPLTSDSPFTRHIAGSDRPWLPSRCLFKPLPSG